MQFANMYAVKSRRCTNMIYEFAISQEMTSIIDNCIVREVTMREVL